MINRYSGLILCKKCGKNFKVKKERKKIKYICSGYDRFGKDYCKREVVKEEELDNLIHQHYGKKLEDFEVRELIKIIEIHNDKWVVRYIDDTETIISNNYYQI